MSAYSKGPPADVYPTCLDAASLAARVALVEDRTAFGAGCHDRNLGLGISPRINTQHVARYRFLGLVAPGRGIVPELTSETVIGLLARCIARSPARRCRSR